MHKVARARPAARRQYQLDLFGAVLPRPFDPQKLVRMALAVWRASRPVAGTLGERFFTSRRLAVPDAAVVRFHPSLKFGDGRAPGLVWLLRDQRTAEPCGIVRVFLDSDGAPIGKRTLGRALGACINRARGPP
jgi:hypothetical protein